MKNKIIIGGLILTTLGLISIGVLTKFKHQKIDNNKLYANKIAIYIKNETGNYEKSNTIPTSGYTLNENKSICNNGAIPSWNYTNNNFKIKNLIKENTSCYLYFDKGITINNIITKYQLNNKISNARNSVITVNTEKDDTKLYTVKDKEGINYVYSGINPNNWVKFAGYYWRIVRINSDSTLRLIYNGLTTAQTGETTQIGKSTFNDKYDDNAYVGYMYGKPRSDTYEETHANINESTIKKVLDNWYESNIKNNIIYSSKIDNNAGFCNDRTIGNNEKDDFISLGYSQNKTKYKGISKYTDGINFLMSQTPSLNCRDNDLFTNINSMKGNKTLNNSIGLLTADEVILAGGFAGFVTDQYWLYTGQTYWLMTSSLFDGHAFNASIYANGDLNNSYIHGVNGIRPVINLKADIQFQAGTDGTINNPYIVI